MIEPSNNQQRRYCGARNIATAIRLGLQAEANARLENAIKIAVAAGDAAAAGQLADQCRFKFGYTYKQTLAKFQELTGISANDFEELMYESDTAGSSPSERFDE